MEFDKQATVFKNFGDRKTACVGALRVVGNSEAYEMGLVKNDKGAYDLNWDSYNGGKGLVSVVGTKAGKLLQEYSAAVAIRSMARQGMRVRRTVGAGGKVVLVGEV